MQRLTLEEEKRNMSTLRQEPAPLNGDATCRSIWGEFSPRTPEPVHCTSGYYRDHNGENENWGGTVIANHRTGQYCLETYRQHFCFIMHGSL